MRKLSLDFFCVVQLMEFYSFFAGTVYGFSNGLGSISSILTPLVTASITQNDQENPAKWRIVSCHFSKELMFILGPFEIQNAFKMQSKCSRNAVKYSQNAVKM